MGWAHLNTTGAHPWLPQSIIAVTALLIIVRLITPWFVPRQGMRRAPEGSPRNERSAENTIPRNAPATDQDVLDLIDAGQREAAVSLYAEIHGLPSVNARAHLHDIDSPKPIPLVPLEQRIYGFRVINALGITSSSLSIIGLSSFVDRHPNFIDGYCFATVILLPMSAFFFLANWADVRNTIAELRREGTYPGLSAATDAHVRGLIWLGHFWPALYLYREIHHASFLDALLNIFALKYGSRHAAA